MVYDGLALRMPPKTKLLHERRIRSTPHYSQSCVCEVRGGLLFSATVLLGCSIIGSNAVDADTIDVVDSFYLFFMNSVSSKYDIQTFKTYRPPKTGPSQSQKDCQPRRLRP